MAIPIARYTERLADAGVAPSVGGVGDSYDKALAESINNFHETGVIRHGGPRPNLDAVELASREWGGTALLASTVADDRC